MNAEKIVSAPTLKDVLSKAIRVANQLGLEGKEISSFQAQEVCDNNRGSQTIVRWQCVMQFSLPSVRGAVRDGTAKDIEGLEETQPL